MNPYHDLVIEDSPIDNIVEEIKDFESSLDDNHDMVFHFGSCGIMIVKRISFMKPKLMCFDGYINQRKARIIQHLSQLNFVLLAVPRAEPNKPKTPIGFNLNNES